MSQDHDGKISPNSVMYGDVIEFYDCLENRGDPSDTPLVGLVVDIKENKQHVLGLRVLPLEEESRNHYIEKGNNFYLVSNVHDVDDMGLNTDRVYKVLYSELTVANHPEHVGGLGCEHKGVRRHGTLQGTDLFEKIVRHRNNNVPGSLGFKGNGNTIEDIETYQMPEKGKNVYKARARQDRRNSEDDSSAPTLDFPHN